VTFRTSSRFSEASWAARESTCVAKYTLLVRRSQSPKPMTGCLQCSSLERLPFSGTMEASIRVSFFLSRNCQSQRSHISGTISPTLRVLTYMRKRLFVFRPLCNAFQTHHGVTTTLNLLPPIAYTQA
jgi:hypothetical protein